MKSLAEKALIFAIMVAISTVTLVEAQTVPPPCVDDQPFTDPENCTTYYQCFDIGGGELVLVHLACPVDGYWDGSACVEGTCENPTTTTEAPTETTTPEGTTVTSSESTSTSEAATSTTESTSTSELTTEGSTSTTEGSTSTTEGSTSTTEGSTSTPEGSTSTSEIPSTSSEEPTTEGPTTIGPPTFVCVETGFFGHPTNPTQYYQCVLVGAQFYYYVYTCPPQSCFQEAARACVVGTCPTNATTTPTTTTTTTPTPTTTTPAPVNITCNSQGQFPYPGSCTRYYNCILYQGKFVYSVFQCPPETYFNTATRLCTRGQCPATPAPTTATTSDSASTESTAVTTPEPFSCTQEGMFANPLSCTSYNRCILIRGLFYYFTYTCPPGSKFDVASSLCVVGTC